MHVPTDLCLRSLYPDYSPHSHIGGRLSIDSCSFFHCSLSWLKPDAGIEDVRTTVVVVEHPLDFFFFPGFIACTDAGDLGFAIVHEVDDDLGFHAYLSWFVSSYIYNVTPFLSLLKFIRENKQAK